MRLPLLLPPLLLALAAAPAVAQDVPPQAPPAGPPPGQTVFDDTWVTVGVGGALLPSYSGSDDYRIAVLPVVQGKVAGVRIEPRPAGLALNLLPETRDRPSLSFGPVARLRSDRADDIEDPVVALAGELDRAVELGASAGINVPGLLSRFDTLSFTLDVRHDVAGAHSGMTVQPQISWGSPVSRAMFVQVGVGAEFVSDDFARYYQSVSPAQAAASGLPQFEADGGLNSIGANLLVGYDLDGNALNGGLGLVAIAGYSRLQGDAARTPYTAIRGDADQALLVLGLGYTF